MRMSVSSRDGRNACVEGVGCRVWRGVEPPRVEDYPIPKSPNKSLIGKTFFLSVNFLPHIADTQILSAN